jgi:hypothetical protein
LQSCTGYTKSINFHKVRARPCAFRASCVVLTMYFIATSL